MSFHDLRRGTLLCYQSDLIAFPHGFTTRLGASAPDILPP